MSETNGVVRQQLRIGSAIRLPRNELFAGLFIIAATNGLAGPVLSRLTTGAWLFADVNVLILVAVLATTGQLLGIGRTGATSRDLAVAASILFLVALPFSPAGWLAVTILGAYLALSDRANDKSRRAGWIALALTVPMFWNRVLMSIFGDVILTVDATVVSLLLGAGRNGNAVAFADGWGYFWIAPQCSSLLNASLAVLAFVLVAQTVPDRMRPPNSLLLATIPTVIVINVLRITLAGLSRENYDAIHGDIGSMIFAILFTTAAVAIPLALALKKANARAESGSHA